MDRTTRITVVKRRQVAPGIEVRLSTYPPGLAQGPHRHDASQLSFHLAGGLYERLGQREYDVCGLGVGWKPAEESHSNCWGKRGAVLFTVQFSPGFDEEWTEGIDPGWRRVMDPESLVGDARRLLRGAGVQGLADLISWVSPNAARRRKEPPHWLTQVRASLIEDPFGTRIGQIAAELGTHRVHLTRCFKDHFGVTPGVFRQQQMVAALAHRLTATTYPVAECALDAGFSDQSHATRAMQSSVGVPPGEFRRASRQNVAFVQAEVALHR